MKKIYRQELKWFNPVTEWEHHVRHKHSAMQRHFRRLKCELLPVDQDVRINNAMLMEAAAYEFEKLHVFYLKADDNIHLSVRRQASMPVEGISFSAITNDVPPYNELAHRFEEHYSSMNLPVPIEVVIHREEPENFHMAAARNRSIDKCEKSHVFVLDLDVYLTQYQVLDVIARYDKHGFGVVHLKRNRYSGNGLYFGARSMFDVNRYDERFKRFFYEDTEFFANWSRVGVIPLIVFMDYEHLPHDRPVSWAYSQADNHQRFLKSMTRGREFE